MRNRTGLDGQGDIATKCMKRQTLTKVFTHSLGAGRMRNVPAWFPSSCLSPASPPPLLCCVHCRAAARYKRQGQAELRMDS